MDRNSAGGNVAERLVYAVGVTPGDPLDDRELEWFDRAKDVVARRGPRGGQGSRVLRPVRRELPADDPSAPRAAVTLEDLPDRRAMKARQRGQPHRTPVRASARVNDPLLPLGSQRMQDFGTGGLGARSS